ncbi:MAG: hypothetical protein PHI16_05610, partial [Methanocellales archaeon]|nr:hypothetical protein [Methanocellales archaeon]
GQTNVTILAQRKTVAGGYTQKEVSESEQRRLQRAARLYAEARGYSTDSRIQVTVIAAGEPNLQRERTLANGTVQITITTTEADQIATELEKATAETGGDAMGVAEVLNREVVAMLDTAPETDTATQETVRNTIQERVAARLNERLESMTMEERATARGLLRLQADGKLDEYFASLFSGQASQAVDAELNGAGGYSVYYLLDTDVLVGAGHAAMIMGSDSEGWYYFSFGYGSNVLTANGNMDAEYFITLKEAQKTLDRYGSYLRWNVQNSSSIRSAFREASSHLTDNYSLSSHNCDDVAVKIIRASGVQLQDEWKPTNTFNYYWGEADEIGNWEVSVQ